MAGLNCGTVSRTAWPVLRDGCDAAVAVDDDEARRAVADLDAARGLLRPQRRRHLGRRPRRLDRPRTPNRPRTAR